MLNWALTLTITIYNYFQTVQFFFRNFFIPLAATSASGFLLVDPPLPVLDLLDPAGLEFVVSVFSESNKK